MRMPIFFCLEAKVTSTIYSCKQLPKLKKPPERKVDLRLSGIHTPMKVALATPIINVSETKLAYDYTLSKKKVIINVCSDT